MHPEMLGFGKVRARWYRAIRLNPENVQVLLNAARFFDSLSTSTAGKLRKRIEALRTE
jgi:hypothetical protein